MENKYHLLKGKGSKNSPDVERQQRKSVCYYQRAEITLFHQCATPAARAVGY